MAKRFTDTAKWDKSWYRKLGSRLRDLRSYILDKCDHAAIIEIDLETFQHFIGEPVSMDDISKAFRNRIQIVNDDKLFIPSFIKFQYKVDVIGLNPENKVHRSVIQRLKSLGIIKPLASSSQGAKDKDKDKDKAKDKNKAKDKALKFDFDIIYKYYPKQTGGKAGITKLKSSVKTPEKYEQLKLALKRYVNHCQHNVSDPQYILGFKTWANNWEDWIPEDAGQVVIDIKPEPSKAQKKSMSNYELYQKANKGDI